MSSQEKTVEIGSPETQVPKNIQKQFKKQITISTGMNVNSQMENLSSEDLKTNIINRTNSLVCNDENNVTSNSEQNGILHKKHSLLGNSHNLSYGNNMHKFSDNLQVNNSFALHRSNEIENLTDQELVNEFDDDLAKSNLELFNGKSHLKRTLELENLDEINND